MNLQDDTATALVNFIQTKLTSDNVVSQSVLKVGLYDVVIPAGQVKYVKCKVSSTVDMSNPLVLFELRATHNCNSLMLATASSQFVMPESHMSKYLLATTLSTM